MKKNYKFLPFLSKKWGMNLLIMSNFSVVFLLLAMNVSASVLGQRVSLNMSDASLEECIHMIEKQTDLGFFYKVKQVKKIKGISITAEDKPITAVLDELLSFTGLTYEIENDVILIKNRPILDPIGARGISLGKYEIVQTVKGVVTDEQGEPMPGATVLEKGTTNGVATNLDGQYSIDVKGDNAILVFAFLGHESQEIVVGSQAAINVSLKEVANELNDAVVVGYGSTKRKDLTGSVVRVDPKTFEKSAFTNIGQMIQGQVAGVDVVSGNGRPGDQVRIRIRGESSLQGSADPLIVIDEVPMPDDYDLNFLNPNDVENIDILKGASAAAIYGSKGAAGVVLITTKQGDGQGAEIFYNGNVSTRGYNYNVKSLGVEDWKRLVLREFAYEHQYSNMSTPDRYKDLRQNSYYRTFLAPGGYFAEGDTDWGDALTQTPLNTNHSLGIKGGNKEASYYASLGYTKDQGIIIGSKSDRLTVSLKMDLRPKKWFELGFQVRGTNNPVSSTIDYNNALKNRPDAPVYNEDGSYYRYYSNRYSTYRDNALQIARESPTERENFDYTLSGYGRVIIAKDFRYQFTYSYSKSTSESSRYQGTYTENGSNNDRKGLLNVSSGYSQQLNVDNTLHYTKTKGKHDLSALIGTTFNQDKAGRVSSTYQDFPDDYIQNAPYSATNWNGTSGNDDASAYFSLYGRVNYRYHERYLFTGTVRRDASSKFSPANRAGVFPAAALAWILTEEDFLKGNSVSLSFLKLRVEHGITGNNRIGRYAWRSGFGSTQYFGQPGSYPTTIGNDQVRWEETAQTDLALDFGFFNNKILGSIGWYNKDTEGLLFGYSLAPSAGLTSVNVNFAEINNKGIEFDVKAQVIEKPGMLLSVGFNIARNRGVVGKLDQQIAGSAQGGDPGYYSTSVLAEGYPVGLIYGYRTDGIVKTPEEWAAIKARIDRFYPRLGGYAYKDLNDDGRLLSGDDREVIGTSVPDFFGGFNVDFRYKNFTARLSGKYSYGAQKHWTGLQDQFHVNLYNPDNVLEYALQAWTPNNINSTFQRFGASWEKFISDNYVYDASFLKLSELNIGYDLPLMWVDRLGLSGANVYASVNNLHTFTKYPGTNVEAYSSDPVSGAGQDYSIYPLSRTYTIGVKLSLR